MDIPANTARQLSPPKVEHLSARAILLRKASQKIPQTAEDLPVGFYRADLIHIEANDQSVSEAERQLREVEVLQAAYCDLNYELGYPTLPSGEPFWHKLDYEPGLAYGAFQIFLDQAKTDARELSDLARNEEFKQVLQHHNSTTELSHEDILRTLNEYYTLYYWRQRSKAYDLFKEAAYRHKRIQRAMATEDSHYMLAESLLQKVESYLGSEDFTKGLTPRVAIEALSRLVAIQRISAGLPAAGPLTAKETPDATQFEMILRNLGIQQATGAGSSGMPGQRRSAALDNIMSDPTTARTMQELIIRVTTSSFQMANDAEAGASDTNNNGHGQGRGSRYKPSANDIADAELADDIDFHKS